MSLLKLKAACLLLRLKQRLIFKGTIQVQSSPGNLWSRCSSVHKITDLVQLIALFMENKMLRCCSLQASVFTLLFCSLTMIFFLRVSSGSDKIHKVLKPLRRRMPQSRIIWMADCSSAPQTHLGVSSMPQRYRHVPKRPTPVLTLFSATHRLRGSSEPNGGKGQLIAIRIRYPHIKTFNFL